MITERTNPRNTVEIWLQQLRNGADAEKASSTADRIIELSQAQLSMTASSDEADPEKMRKLLEGGRFAAKARRYLERNWSLNIGIAFDKSQVGTALRKRQITHAAGQALRALPLAAGTVTSISGAAVVEWTELAVKGLTDPANRMHGMHGEGTGILLREILGLPGDARPCENIQDPQVMFCALKAMEQLGVEVTPEAYSALETKHEAARLEGAARPEADEEEPALG